MPVGPMRSAPLFFLSFVPSFLRAFWFPPNLPNINTRLYYFTRKDTSYDCQLSVAMVAWTAPGQPDESAPIGPQSASSLAHGNAMMHGAYLACR